MEIYNIQKAHGNVLIFKKQNILDQKPSQLKSLISRINKIIDKRSTKGYTTVHIRILNITQKQRLICKEITSLLIQSNYHIYCNWTGLLFYHIKIEW